MLQPLCGMGKLRLLPPMIEGPPKGPIPLRVSATRQGVTGTKPNPEKVPPNVTVALMSLFMITVQVFPALEVHPVQPTKVESQPAVAVSVTVVPLL